MTTTTKHVPRRSGVGKRAVLVRRNGRMKPAVHPWAAKHAAILAAQR